MKREDFWYNPGAASAGAIPTGCRAGQFLFLSSQTPVDLETGALIRYPWDLPREGRECIVTGWEFFDAKHGPIRAQTWRIYNNLTKILSQQGSSLRNVIRQRIYLRDVSDTGPMEEIMLSFFQDDKPATMILGVANHGVSSDIRIQVEVIALIPEKGDLHRECIYVPELAKVTAPYPQAVKVGQFLFFSGLLPINPETGKVVTRLEELGDDASQVKSGHLQSDATAEATKAQYWLTTKLMAHVIKSLGGAGAKDIMHENQFFRRGMKELADRYPLREKIYNSREEASTTSTFGMRNLSVIEEAVVNTDAVALLPGPSRREVDVVPERTVGFQPMWIKADPFCFVCGELGLIPAEHQSILSFSDLTDNGRFLAQGRFHDVHTDVMSQAWSIYQSLAQQMREAGSDLSKVVQQMIFVRDVFDYLAVERIASIVFQNRIPPTTMVPVDDIGPYNNLRLEIEIISLTI